jgi:hypothetical protein
MQGRERSFGVLSSSVPRSCVVGVCVSGGQMRIRRCQVGAITTFLPLPTAESSQSKHGEVRFRVPVGCRRSHDQLLKGTRYVTLRLLNWGSYHRWLDGAPFVVYSSRPPP